jgi:hypothetical protein
MEHKPNPEKLSQDRDNVTPDKTLPDRTRGTPAVSAALGHVTFQLTEVALPKELFRKILSLIDDLRRRPTPA